MGDAVLRRFRARPARLPEARRAFLHESTRRWGTPAAPCPILGLTSGGERDIERVGVQLVDHAIWRLAEVLAAALVCRGVGTVGILLLVRKLFFKPASGA